MKAEKVAKRVKELTENEERERLYARGNVKQLRSRLKDLGIKGFSNKNKPLLVERRPTLEGTYREFWMQKSRVWG